MLAIAALAPLALALLYGWVHEPALPALPAPPKPDSALVAAGARVVALGDCMVCHTAPHGMPYAGGLPLRTPFGTIYSTNITPDPETGIGRWSQEAFRRALRRGVARDGHLLYPAFPYTHYTRMTDADIDAAWHYLMSRTPVHAEPRANDLLFPLTWRPLLAFWNALYLKTGDGAPPAATGAVARGRYLADTLGHCGSCHSGLTLAGGERQPPFGGGMIDGWTAPALTRLTQGPAPWTESELADYLRTGLSRGHGAAKGPMRPVTERLADVPGEDVAALAAWLMSIQQPAATATHTAVAARPAATGQALFEGACAGCHATAAPMMRLAARPALARSSAVLGEHPATFIQTVLQGIAWPADQHGQAGPYMPAFAATLTDAQIATIAADVRAAAGVPAWPDTERESARLRKELPR